MGIFNDRCLLYDSSIALDPIVGFLAQPQRHQALARAASCLLVGRGLAAHRCTHMCGTRARCQNASLASGVSNAIALTPDSAQIVDFLNDFSVSSAPLSGFWAPSGMSAITPSRDPLASATDLLDGWSTKWV